MTILSLTTITLGCAAVAEDLARRRISNVTSGLAVGAGAILHVSSSGWRGGATASLGAAAGFGVFLIFYLLNGMGGGDVKLMAGFGSLLGPATILRAAWIAAVIGGLMAAGYAAAMAFNSRRAGAWRAESIPYAPAIVAGVWLAKFGLE